MTHLIFFVSCVGAAAVGDVQLATFDGAQGTTFEWKALNDPVMGGQSYSTFHVNKTSKTGIWRGETKIVPSLNAPGFCNLETEKFFNKFPDVSAYTHIVLRLRSEYSYGGFKFSFAADTINPQFKSYKADFNVTSDGKWQTVSIPFSDFSNDWSPYTGECDTRDPTGKQHHCCTKDNLARCVHKHNLKDIEDLGIWTEGAAGKFHLEIESIGVGFGDTCSSSEYCCPDAKHCLTPSNISCSKDATVCDGTDHPVCCPLTKICVRAGNPCTTPCADEGTYCCPDAKHCLTPTNPGVFCQNQSSCKTNEVCCPLTNLCVAVGEECNPFDRPVAPFWPPQ